MKILKIIGKGILAIIFFIVVMNMVPRPKSVEHNIFRIESGSRPVLIAHGGGNQEFPDNTLEAFYHAYSIDPNVMMETDVNMTKDGVIILSHDRSLDRKTNVSGNIIDWNYTDLVNQDVNFSYENKISGDNGVKVDENLNPYKTYDDRTVTPLDVVYPEGIKARHDSIFLVTTLEELIKTFPNNTINVEIKQTGDTGLAALKETIDLMKRLDEQGYKTFDRIVLASFHDEVYQQIKEYHKEIPSLKFSPNKGGIINLYATHWFGVDFFYNEPVNVLQIPVKEDGFPLDTKYFINAAHRHNIAVHYWTINDKKQMEDLISKGADGIMTDVPSRLKEVLDEMYGQGDSPDLVE